MTALSNPHTPKRTKIPEYIFHPASFLLQSQQKRQEGVDVMRKHQEGQRLVGEEALHSDAEPGSSARQRLPQHEAGLL